MIDPELLAQFEACWIRGRGWRLETGRLLYLIKPTCAYGEWTPFCKKYDLPIRTADEWIQKYKEDAGIAMQPEHEDAEPPLDPDPDADERNADIAKEQDVRRGRKPERHRTELNVKLKQLNPTLIERYYEARDKDPKGVMELWYETFFRILDEGKEPEVLTVGDFEDQLEGTITVEDFEKK